MHLIFRPNGISGSRGVGETVTLGHPKQHFRYVLLLRARGSVWRICPRVTQSGICVNDCPGDLPSAFSGQTEWRWVDRQSSSNRYWGFSERQGATINWITVAQALTAYPPPFRSATQHYRNNNALAAPNTIMKKGNRNWPNGISGSRGVGECGTSTACGKHATT